VGLGVAVFMITNREKKLEIENRRLSIHMNDAAVLENNVTTVTTFKTINTTKPQEPTFEPTGCTKILPALPPAKH